MLMKPVYLWPPLFMSNNDIAEILWQGDDPFKVTMSRMLVCLLGCINELYKVIPLKNLKMMKTVRLIELQHETGPLKPHLAVS